VRVSTERWSEHPRLLKKKKIAEGAICVFMFVINSGTSNFIYSSFVFTQSSNYGRIVYVRKYPPFIPIARPNFENIHN
jgi:hypothetical protein